MGDPFTAQAKFTWPVKPPDGVNVNAVVPLLPAVSVMPPPFVRPKLGGTNWIIIVAGWLVITPLITENVKLSEPENPAGGE